MSIEIHCPKCTKLIRAPESAGGRHGKCPYCENTVYIPMPPDPSDEIGLAPIDEEQERRDEQARREAADLAAKLYRAKEGTLPDGPGPRSASSSTRDVPGEVVDIGQEIKQFVLAMRDSKLDMADQAIDQLKKAGPRARDQVEGLMLDEMPPQFDNVPAPLAKGFLKTLLARLS